MDFDLGSGALALEIGGKGGVGGDGGEGAIFGVEEGGEDGVVELVVNVGMFLIWGKSHVARPGSG